MNTRLSICLVLAASMALAWAAQKFPVATNVPPSPTTPPIYPAPAPQPTLGPTYVYDQKPMGGGGGGGGRPFLIAPEQAQGIINRFKEQYQKLGAPRVVIFVNRELIDENSGVKLSSHKQVVETTKPLAEAAASKPEAVRAAERVVSTNIYRVRDTKERSLADRQTMRDVERLFGRPLRMAGVQLADQRIAAQLLAGRALDGVNADSEQARKDREALGKVADIVLEVLVSSKDVTISDASGEQTYAAPDIQATAVRLADAKILAQATASDLIGQGQSAAMAVRNFGIREITEATALSLMEDMMLQ